MIMSPRRIACPGSTRIAAIGSTIRAARNMATLERGKDLAVRLIP
jgi:hypothetical protein